MRDFIGTGLTSSPANCNVINILRILVEDSECTAYIPYSYLAEKEGRGRDPRVHFPPKSSGRPMQIIDIQSHLERFNFSVNCLIDVKVEHTNDDGIVYLKDMKVWRTYTVIRDGELELPEIAVKLSSEAYKDLLQIKGLLYLGDKELTESFVYDSSAIYTLRLTGLPLLSSNWARPNVLSFHKMLRDSARLSEQVKQCKKLLKESLHEEPADSNIYTETIDYHGSSAGKTVECVSYEIKENPGYSAPKLSQVTKDEYKQLNNTLKDYRFRCACIKWAMESAETHRKSAYAWSDLYQKKRGSTKYYQDCVVDIDGVSYLLQRSVYTKNV